MSARVPVPDAAPALARRLAEANVTRGGLMVALGGDVPGDPAGAMVADRALGAGAQADLARIFLLGASVPQDRAADALEPLTVKALEDEGWLVRADDGGVTCPFQLTPFEDVWLAHDRIGGEAPDSDVVLGTSAAGKTLAALTPREHVGRALDMGTGCGLEALLIARHADHVVATDVNPRALAFTLLGAALSDIHNVETREGDLFDPVTGEEFDLVVSNPPYVISPELGLTYRDGTLGGDDMSRLTVQGAARVLAPGGVAVVLANWVHQPFESWAAPPRTWIEGGGCDALLLHHATEEPLEYAARWNATKANDPVAYGEALDRWLAGFAADGVTSIATGAVVLRRIGEEPALVVEHEMASQPHGLAGAHALRLLAAGEWLAETDNRELLRTPLRLVDDHTLVSARDRTGDSYGEDTVRIELDDSVGLDPGIGESAAAVLIGIDAGRTPADAVPGLAASVETPGVDVTELVAELTRGLVARGILVRA